MRCPKCGHSFRWCNGGDIIVCPSQILPQCPKCKHKAIVCEFNPKFTTINDNKNGLKG